ncbi:beta-N-acetylhexosaminidase [Streptomyces physcomitrii]|uniref:Family 20 glycosylhydrolase n=1 Tax=Streptomyces physcomitrii TaxID=2724184 RepID=A0ABX1GXJ8_9ACTN|nr:glycoside hydrolase family 20 protein [Streptomyces physcomitrii]NKI40507.1 family 20 glycosylhydrolase [Streptomyces physcomitrii]
MSHAANGRSSPRGPGDRRKLLWILVALVAATAVALVFSLWPGDEDGDRGGGEASGADTAAAGTPTPERSYALSKRPRVIPAVSGFEAARGPGWKPGKDAKVVAEDDALDDEAALLASELKLDRATDGDAGAGDVELALDEGVKGGGEAYTLKTEGGRVRITGSRDTGVFYGTRTLKQLVRTGGGVPEGEVHDVPAKPRRGFMLDIARKNFTADWIEQRIREMGDLKLNEFGLHFSDDQAFRIASDSHPEVVSEPHLTKAQVRRIIKLAASRHITVVPEIDSPGHLGAVLKAHPQLQLRSGSGSPVQGTVDIANPAAGKLVDELLKEYAELFKGSDWHLGADEYLALMSADPEGSYPGLAAAARKKYGPNGRVQDLATGWLNDRAKAVRGDGRELRAWNDGFFTGGAVRPAKDLQVAYWTGKESGKREPAEFLAEGRKVLNYNDEYLYYVLGQPNQFVYPTGERIYKEWTPRVIRGTGAVPAKYDSQILGGSFAVWCDLADSQTQDQVAAGIRLPLAAVAQKLWDAGEPPLSWGEFKALAAKAD